MLVLLAAAAAPAQPPPTSLRVDVWPRGTADERRTWKLRCAPAGGTLPQRAAACRRLLSLADPFAPVPREAVCTMIYGGPARARVTGTFEGRRVWATFTRKDGCQIARWRRHGFLFPVALADG